jgi:hypothetical protein
MNWQGLMNGLAWAISLLLLGLMLSDFAKIERRRRSEKDD